MFASAKMLTRFLFACPAKTSCLAETLAWSSQGTGPQDRNRRLPTCTPDACPRQGRVNRRDPKGQAKGPNPWLRGSFFSFDASQPPIVDVRPHTKARWLCSCAVEPDTGRTGTAICEADRRMHGRLRMLFTCQNRRHHFPPAANSGAMSGHQQCVGNFVL